MIVCLGTTPAVQRAMFFERVKLDAVNRTADVRESAAGKSINCARVAATLGEPVAAVGFVGADRIEFFRSDLERSGVRCELLTVGSPTRVCVTMVDRSAGSSTELVQESQLVEAPAWSALKEKLAALLPQARCLALSGTIAPGGAATLYAECCTMAQQAGVQVVVDATGEPLLAAVNRGPDAVKPNRAELAQALNRPVETEADVVAGMRQLIERGARRVLVTAGKARVYAGEGLRVWRIDVPSVPAVNPIGSGDAVCAGLATGMVRGMDFSEACRLAVACGAANALTELAGHVRVSDVQRLMSDIHLHDLS